MQKCHFLILYEPCRKGVSCNRLLKKGADERRMVSHFASWPLWLASNLNIYSLLYNELWVTLRFAWLHQFVGLLLHGMVWPSIMTFIVSLHRVTLIPLTTKTTTFALWDFAFYTSLPHFQNFAFLTRLFSHFISTLKSVYCRFYASAFQILSTSF